MTAGFSFFSILLIHYLLPYSLTFGWTLWSSSKIVSSHYFVTKFGLFAIIFNFSTLSHQFLLFLPFALCDFEKILM